MKVDSAEPAREPFWRRLFEPVDIASIVFFRIAFGAILFYEIVRYAKLGRVRAYWIEPTFNFSYYLTDWVHPWPGDGMLYHWAILGLLSLLIMLGCFYRAATTLFCAGFTYVFLLEESKYLNHFYFICLISFLMIFIPAHRSFSLAAWRRPDIRLDSVPTWMLWALCAQMGTVYFFGGIAKLSPDWLRGEPMRFWLANRIDYPVLGPLFATDWAAWLFSYGGLILDLSIVPLLLWRRTRLFAFLWAVSFHLLNKWMLGVGIFPWFSIVATSLFFPPDWPRRLASRLLPSSTRRAPAAARVGRRQRLTLACLAVFFAIQLLVPLRKHLYPGAVNWTEQGHNFSWHMKLRDKSARATFFVTDPAAGETWRVRSSDYLTPRQIRKMAIRPHMILKFSHYLADRLRAEGRGDVEVRARVWCSLNGRKPQLLIDPEVDLAATPRSLKRADWILPLREPLPPPAWTRRQAAWYRGDLRDAESGMDELQLLSRLEGD